MELQFDTPAQVMRIIGGDQMINGARMANLSANYAAKRGIKHAVDGNDTIAVKTPAAEADSTMAIGIIMADAVADLVDPIPEACVIDPVTLVETGTTDEVPLQTAAEVPIAPAALEVEDQSQYGRMFVEMKVNKVAAFAMVDTGSTVTIVSKDLAQVGIKPEDIKPRVQDLRSASGHALDLVGEAMVQVRLGHRTVPLNGVIARNFGKAVLLGDDFLLKAKMTVNYYPEREVRIAGSREIRCR